MLLAAAFLAEFLSAGDIPALSLLTRAPERRPLAVSGGGAVDVVTPRGTPPPLVLVHGFAPLGKDDPRVGRAAELLARMGFAVAVPTIPGLTQGRLRPEDTEPVVNALAARPGPATLVAVSVGAGPALLAAADPRVRDRVSTSLVLGGYASASELVRYFLTGRYAYGDQTGRVVHDPELVRAFVAANADLVDRALLPALTDSDPAAVEAVLRSRGPLLDALSPERVASRLSGRLLLVHGRGDRAVPYTESLRLAAARPGTEVIIVDVIGHVERDGGVLRAGARTLRDFARLWLVVYAITPA